MCGIKLHPPTAFYAVPVINDLHLDYVMWVEEIPPRQFSPAGLVGISMEMGLQLCLDSTPTIKYIVGGCDKNDDTRRSWRLVQLNATWTFGAIREHHRPLHGNKQVLDDLCAIAN